MPPWRVFVSHTAELRPYLTAVERAISAAGHAVVEMAGFPASADTSADLCAARVRGCDVYLGVLGTRYGSPVRDRPDVSYTELEFDTAGEAGLPRLMFLLDTESQTLGLPPSALIDHEYGARQEAFRQRVRGSGLTTQTFGSPAELGQLVERSLRALPVARRSSYLAQVRDIAPAGGLIGREAELASLADGTEPYEWWQAPPWAGRSALMAWFVLHPPPGMHVVSFFITGRLAAQADATAFTEALIEQLAVLLGEPVPLSLSPGQADATRRELLDRAAAGRRLVLVVDGLDEDTGGVPGSGLPSIASILPKHIPDGLRVIVAGRESSELPSDVPADHPLALCPLRTLAASSLATDMARAARRELDERLLRGDHRTRELLALITAAGGGLATADLGELTGLLPYEVEALLPGRLLASRRGLHLFAHETLREEATRRLGRLVDEHRERVHAWVDGYRERGWPAGTPAYALSGYFAMLTETRNEERAAAAAVDPVRHDRMRAHTGGDAAGLAEVRAVQARILTSPEPDLSTMARLMAHRGTLTRRGHDVPVLLPAVWALLGHRDRAKALAYGLPSGRDMDIAELADAIAASGDPDDAERVAHRITDPEARTRALAAIIRWTDSERAETLATEAESTAPTITDRRERHLALHLLAEALCSVDDAERAVKVAARIEDPADHARVLTELIADRDPSRAVALTAAAEAAVRTIEDPQERVTAACSLLMASGRTRTTELVAVANEAAGQIIDPGDRGVALRRIAFTLARSGVTDRAEALAEFLEARPRNSAGELVTELLGAGREEVAAALLSRLRPGYARLDALASSAVAAVAAGRTEKADRILAEIEAAYRDADRGIGFLPDHRPLIRATASVAGAERAAAVVDAAVTTVDSETYYRSTDLRRALVEALIETGEWERASEMIAGLDFAEDRRESSDRLITAVMRTGDLDRAYAYAAVIPELDDRVTAVHTVLIGASRRGDLDRVARIVAGSVPLIPEAVDTVGVYPGLRDLADAAYRAGDRDRGRTIATAAGTAVRELADPAARAAAWLFVADTTIDGDDPALAETLLTDSRNAARELAPDIESAVALLRLVDPAAKAGLTGFAADVMAEVEAAVPAFPDGLPNRPRDPSLLKAVFEAGDPERAIRMARDRLDPLHRAHGLLQLVSAAITVNDRERAESLFGESLRAHDNAKRGVEHLFDEAFEAGQHEFAQTIFRFVTDSETLRSAFDRLITAPADLRRTQALVRTIDDANDRAWCLLRLIPVVAVVDDEWAEILTDELVTEHITDLATIVSMMCMLIPVADPEELPEMLDSAGLLIDRLENPADRAPMLLELIGAAIEAGRPEYARSLFIDVETSAVERGAGLDGLELLAGLAARAVAIGDSPYAEALALRQPDPDDQAAVLASAAAALPPDATQDHRRLIALALSRGSAEECDMQLALHYPEALSAAADQLVRELRKTPSRSPGGPGQYG
uniref:DUF4062 domain-containing protein n=1 Tax=Paractinoplanes polyasparticus TaxID=2856853 RepID=UPI001C844585|nr:DUF4062 domain-containing protein [Actinoplanes polyasparticus]